MHKRLIAGLMLGSAAFLSGQDQPADPPKRGTVSGLTVDGKSGEPVRKALVILRLVPSSEGAKTLAEAQPGGIGITSDAAGKFTFQNLEPGTYAATAGRDGYVAARESLRQMVTVKAGEAADELQIKMLRTGVISGRVLDSDGEPVRNAAIQIRSARQQRTNAQSGSGASTNDRGEYRAFGISPGEYKLSATYSPGNAQQFDVRMQAAKKGSELADATAYPTLYYPDTLNSQQAIAVAVEPGSELQGYDFHLRRQHAVTVGGRITGPVAAFPLSVMFVELIPLGGAPGQAHQLLVRDPEGRFELPDVLPGTYRLSATRINMTGNGESESHRLTANRTLHVEGVDLKGIQLAVGALLKLNGRFVLPEGRTLPPGLTFMLEPRDLDDTQSGEMAAVGADGNFVLSGVSPGVYSAVIGSMTPDTAAADLYISGIHLGDIDVLAEGVSLGQSAPSSSFEIFLKANGGTLESVVKDEKEKPLPAAQVWLVPDAPKQQQRALFGDCRTDSKGSCRITGITPGEYHVYAFPTEITPDRRDPEALQALKQYGKPVTFTEGKKHSIELTAAPVE